MAVQNQNELEALSGEIRDETTDGANTASRVGVLFFNLVQTLFGNLGNKVDKVSGKGLSTYDYDDAAVTKLADIEDSATGDQTNIEIRNAYNNLVSLVSKEEAEEGLGEIVRRWSPLRVSQAVKKIASNNYVNVDIYGATGDGTTDDSEAIQTAIDANENYTALLFTSGKTYILKNKITLKAGNVLMGHGAVVKRANKLVTTITAPVLQGANVLPVANASIYNIGDDIIITDSTSPNAGLSGDETSGNVSGQSANKIVSITGNNITLAAGISLPANGNLNISGEFAIGEKVVKVYTLIQAGEDAKVLGLTIDGNKDNNDETYSWYYNKNLFFTSNSQSVLVDGCTFINVPCENIILSHRSRIVNNNALDLNGSFVHISNAGAVGVGDVIVSQNTIKNVCGQSEINGHAEGVVTCSARSRKTIISNNIINNCGAAIFGSMSASTDIDSEVIISSNLCYDMLSILKSDAVGVSILNFINISGNYFKNCGLIQVNGDFNSVSKGGGSDKLNISSNTIINGGIRVVSATNIIIEANIIIEEPGADIGINSAIRMEQCSNFSIKNNVIEDRELLISNIKTGIIYNSYTNFSVIKTDSLTLSKFAYDLRNSDIEGNKIINFGTGIDDESADDGARNAATIGFVIKNNIIQIKSHVDSVRGMRVVGGAFVFGNYIYGDGNANQGILVHGVESGSNAIINGAVVVGNYVLGFTESFQIGYNSVQSANIFVKDNYYDGTIDDNSGGVASIVGNTQLVNNSVPIKLLRENDDWY